MSQFDKNSGTWRAVKAHCEMEIVEAHKGLERMDMNDVDTQQCRGYIKALRRVIALEEPPAELAGKIPSKPRY